MPNALIRALLKEQQREHWIRAIMERRGLGKIDRATAREQIDAVITQFAFTPDEEKALEQSRKAKRG